MIGAIIGLRRRSLPLKVLLPLQAVFIVVLIVAVMCGRIAIWHFAGLSDCVGCLHPSLSAASSPPKGPVPRHPSVWHVLAVVL